MGTFKFDEIVCNSTEKKKPVDEDKYTYLGLEHLDSDSIYITRYESDVAPKGDKLIMKKGDVLFGKRRAYQKKVAIAPFDGIFSAHGMVLRPKEDVIDKDFFPMLIKSDCFLDAAIKISVGSLSPTINWRDLKELAFDGHCICSASDDNALAEQGNKANTFKDDQINVLMAYDIDTSRHVLSRVYFGGTLDRISVKDLIERKRLHSILFIVDKCFYSKENITVFSKDDNHYIITLWDNHKASKEVTGTNEMEGLFVFERSRKEAP